MTQVLVCNGCGRPAPGSHEAFVECQYCGAMVSVPEAFRARASALLRVERERETTEAVWAKVARGSSARTRTFAFALTACVPPAVAWIANGWGPHLGGVALLGRAALPALAPGALLYGYSATAESLRRAFEEGLASACTEGVHQCRQCGAPLLRSAGAFGSTCMYCGADNLVAGAVRRAQRRAALTTQTLSDAIADLRMRQRVAMLVCFGIAASLIAFGFALDHLATMA